ncbi:hypothetical protein EV143_10582 [Flavobacterium chryseum]|uniref:hypothetical protein n=1 Tax=Flavobacterium sp. P3160 TaxID=2512113 RepID=UPI00105B96C6|nr:hypothetical protein [Flavobacterium sp. P3160]TDO73490.1 hypothetical protein EV143_10582 [Flavobacterium sp. P3160]
MKKILFVVVQVLLLNQVNAQNLLSDWQKMRLKGTIDKIVEIHERCPSIMAEGGSFYCPKDTITYKFTEKGYLTNSNSENENVKKTTLNGFQYVTTYENVKGLNKKSFEDVYNVKKQLIKQSSYYVHDTEERILNQWEYFYNKNGNKVKEKSTEWWNNIATVVLSDLNEYGDIIKRQTIRNDKITNEEEFNYKYTNDKYGNWINKTSSGSYNETWTRKITY